MADPTPEEIAALRASLDEADAIVAGLSPEDAERALVKIRSAAGIDPAAEDLTAWTPGDAAFAAFLDQVERELAEIPDSEHRRAMNEIRRRVGLEPLVGPEEESTEELALGKEFALTFEVIDEVCAAIPQEEVQRGLDKLLRWRDQAKVCPCNCGCEANGEWHFEDGAGCACVGLGCPCVTDKRGVASP